MKSIWLTSDGSYPPRLQCTTDFLSKACLVFKHAKKVKYVVKFFILGTMQLCFAYSSKDVQCHT